MRSRLLTNYKKCPRTNEINDARLRPFRDKLALVNRTISTFGSNVPFLKKDQLASIFSRLGVLRLLEAAPRRPQLLVLNYHRIGDADSSPYDPGVFSTSAQGFEEQIQLLKKRYRFATVSQALDIIEGRESISETMILITFDDGYRDNFKLAFPVLQRHGVEAIFFLVTSSIATQQLPWWDEIAYLAKLHAPKTLRISYPHVEDFDLTPAYFDKSLRRLLSALKTPATIDLPAFLTMMRAAVGFTGEAPLAELTMTWDEARAMRAGGMTIGMHSHSHRILAKLTLEEQIAELKACRTKLEQEMGSPVVLLSYPVGTRETFNADTIAAANEVGIRAGFSFYGGTNLPGSIDPFDIRRVAFESYTPAARVRLATALMAVTGTRWI